MIHGFVVLLLCQLAGEAAARGLGLPVPGPVLGLVVLFVGLRLHARRRPAEAQPVEPPEGLARVSDGLLQNLALLFVPAGAGVVQHLGLLREHGAALAVALVASTALTLAATVFAFRAVARRFGEPS